MKKLESNEIEKISGGNIAFEKWYRGMVAYVHFCSKRKKKFLFAFEK